MEKATPFYSTSSHALKGPACKLIERLCQDADTAFPSRASVLAWSCSQVKQRQRRESLWWNSPEKEFFLVAVLALTHTPLCPPLGKGTQAGFICQWQSRSLFDTDVQWYSCALSVPEHVNHTVGGLSSYQTLENVQSHVSPPSCPCTLRPGTNELWEALNLPGGCNPHWGLTQREVEVKGNVQAIGSGGKRGTGKGGHWV